MEYCMLGTSAFHKVQQQLMMPRKAFLSQKEKQARARERDMLKKRRRRQDYLKRSVEPQKNAETIKWHRDDEKRRENEQVKDKDIKKRWRQDERERRKNVDAMNWRREDEKRENERAGDVAALLGRLLCLQPFTVNTGAVTICGEIVPLVSSSKDLAT